MRVNDENWDETNTKDQQEYAYTHVHIRSNAHSMYKNNTCYVHSTIYLSIIRKIIYVKSTVHCGACKKYKFQMMRVKHYVILKYVAATYMWRGAKGNEKNSSAKKCHWFHIQHRVFHLFDSLVFSSFYVFRVERIQSFNQFRLLYILPSVKMSSESSVTWHTLGIQVNKNE